MDEPQLQQAQASVEAACAAAAANPTSFAASEAMLNEFRASPAAPHISRHILQVYALDENGRTFHLHNPYMRPLWQYVEWRAFMPRGV